VERFHHADTGTEDAIKSVLVEIQTVKQKVVTNLQSISELGHSQGNWRDPKIISLGMGTYYIVCDIEWSWMDHPLEIKLPMNKPCSIPETVCTTLFRWILILLILYGIHSPSKK
jgi:hypothetical protein